MSKIVVLPFLFSQSKIKCSYSNLTWNMLADKFYQLLCLKNAIDPWNWEIRCQGCDTAQYWGLLSSLRARWRHCQGYPRGLLFFDTFLRSRILKTSFLGPSSTVLSLRKVSNLQTIVRVKIKRVVDRSAIFLSHLTFKWTIFWHFWLQLI